MSSVKDFYAQARWGTLFGVVDAAHKNGHRGMDFKQAAHTPIPALRGGRVALVRSNTSELGTVVVIQVGPDDFDGYAHCADVVVSVGQGVGQGGEFAKVAGFGDDHGSAWFGPHTHLTNSPIDTGIFQGTVHDPKPLVIGVLSGSASEGGNNPIPAPSPEPKTEDLDMKLYFYKGSAGQAYMLVGPGVADDISRDAAVAWGVLTHQNADSLDVIGDGSRNEVRAARDRFQDSIAAKVKA